MRTRLSRFAARALGVALLAPAAVACQAQVSDDSDAEEEVRARIEAELDGALTRIETVADSLDEQLRPLPLLTPGEEAALRRYLNQAQLARARALGIRPPDRAAVDSLVEDGALVVLEDSTEHWVVRDLRASSRAVVPDVPILLGRIGERFHQRLAELGLPPFRLEISSVLRTAEGQARLRRTNPNAAAGTSTHEYGTTVDMIYAAYAAPASPAIPLDVPDAPWLAPHLREVADDALERVAGRRALELKAILGSVLRELQAEGQVMVTLERQQPVYHMTVARSLAGEGS